MYRIFIISCLMVFSLTLNAQGYGDMKGEIFDVDSVRGQLRPIWQGQKHTAAEVKYFQYYGLDIEPGKYEHFFGAFDSNDFTLSAHIYRPKEYKATVVILHGYLGHCGLLSKLIESLLKEDYAVACFDLPGHGLSSGESAYIEDFAQYTQALKDFMIVLKPQMAEPYHLIGHSTGGSCVIDYLLREKGEDFDKVILAAPLVRSVLWNSSKIGHKFYGLFSKRIGRVFRNNSSDKDFLQFVKYRDPLQARKVPLRWTKALYEWNDKIACAEISDKSILVIQGKADSTVDYKFNIRFLRSKFPNMQIKFIENARHELFNESSEIREEVFFQIEDQLDK
jgi:alpha-beta hydrolase superfamily lysophospholipase